MSEFLLKLLGYDAAKIPEGATTELVWSNMPESWAVFILLALIVGLVWGVFWIYRREIKSCPPRVRILLGVVRAAILVQLILVMLGPALRISTQRTVEPYVVVLVDKSLSMSLPDRYQPEVADQNAKALGVDSTQLQQGQLTRAQITNILLARNDFETLEQLRKVNNIKVMTFNSGVADLDTFTVVKPVDPKATSARTRSTNTLPFDLAFWLGAPSLLLIVLAVIMLRDQTSAMVGSIAGVLILAVVGGFIITTLYETPAEAKTTEQPQKELEDRPVKLTEITPTGSGGTATNLADALREALTLQSRNPVAGIIVLTDGQFTEGGDPVAMLEAMNQVNVPIYTVGIGQPTEPQNIKVAEMWAPDSVFRDDPFIIEAQVRATGCDGKQVEVELVERPIMSDGSTGSETVIKTKPVTFASDDAEQRISYEHKPTKAGDYVYTIRIQPLPTELVQSDNSRSGTVKVLSNQARVLLIAGGPTWEYRNLSQLLIRDKTIKVSCWQQSMDRDMRQDGDKNAVISALPRKPEDLYKYDLIIMLDPSPRDFDMQWMKTLKTFLDEHAGGLLYMAGPKYTDDFLKTVRAHGILDILPVTMSQMVRTDVTSLISTHTKQWPIKLTSAAVDHAMMRLDKDPAVNRTMWEAMPGLYWSYPVRDSKPAAQVLVEHPDPRLKVRGKPRPLIVAGQYGPGRVVYMGFSGTWRWRKLGEEYFDQYWIQSVRYLIEGRLMGGKKRGRIETERDTFDLGSRITITARLFDKTFKPLIQPHIEALVSSPNNRTQTVTLKPVPNQEGQYQGTIIATHIGINEIAINLTNGGDGPVRIAKQINVQVPRIEFADPRLNVGTLQALADRSGGQYLSASRFSELPTLIGDKTKVLIEQDKPASLWDTDRLLITLLLLLTFEWALRKKYKLM